MKDQDEFVLFLQILFVKSNLSEGLVLVIPRGFRCPYTRTYMIGKEMIVRFEYSCVVEVHRSKRVQAFEFQLEMVARSKIGSADMDFAPEKPILLRDPLDFMLIPALIGMRYLLSLHQLEVNLGGELRASGPSWAHHLLRQGSLIGFPLFVLPTDRLDPDMTCHDGECGRDGTEAVLWFD